MPSSLRVISKDSCARSIGAVLVRPRKVRQENSVVTVWKWVNYDLPRDMCKREKLNAGDTCIAVKCERSDGGGARYCSLRVR